MYHVNRSVSEKYGHIYIKEIRIYTCITQREIDIDRFVS